MFNRPKYTEEERIEQLELTPDKLHECRRQYRRSSLPVPRPSTTELSPPRFRRRVQGKIAVAKTADELSMCNLGDADSRNLIIRRTSHLLLAREQGHTWYPNASITRCASLLFGIPACQSLRSRIMTSPLLQDGWIGARVCLRCSLTSSRIGGMTLPTSAVGYGLMSSSVVATFWSR